MGGANQYRETGEWAFEHQTELEVGSDGDLPLSRTTNQVRRFVRGDYCIVNEGGTAGFSRPSCESSHDWTGRPFSYTTI